ncbi:DNA helicase MCM9-like [Ctenocephalides felis]|uniref:DNA helicase MCM9-like n=1 Tax=Ctenocephalides felis TaxID=7515 RepID=UPI000E6E4A3B|nr:DNA helicase MCM9-like [Ctenocephalides felis]
MEEFLLNFHRQDIETILEHDDDTKYFSLHVKYCDKNDPSKDEQMGHQGVGSLPATIWISLGEDLVDTCQTGDDIIVCGIVQRRWKYITVNRHLDVSLSIRANSVTVVTKQDNDVETETATDSWIKKFWFDHRENVVLTIIGGTSNSNNSKQLNTKYTTNEDEPVRCSQFLSTQRTPSQEDKGSDVSVRGQSHLLLVGDPGTGKSELLKFAQKLVARSVLTTGIGSICWFNCSCCMGRESSEWTLEAGALVLCDGGVCFMDEFTSMKEQDRASIHEAMEQQTISVAKAGMVCKLSTRCSVIAAANPRKRYNQIDSISANIVIAPPLLSRFDLIFILKDLHDAKWDSLVADHILFGEKSDFETSVIDSEKWTVKMFKSYFEFIKNINPVMTEEAELILSAYYQYKRMSQYRDASRTTVRLLDSLIRLSQAHARLMFKKHVEAVDAVTTIILMEYSMQSDNSSGHISMVDLQDPIKAKKIEDYERLHRQILGKLDLEDLVKDQREDESCGSNNILSSQTLCKSRFESKDEEDMVGLSNKPNFIKELLYCSQTSFNKNSNSSMVNNLQGSTHSSGESANKSKDNCRITKSLNDKPDFIKKLLNRSQTSLDKNSNSSMVKHLDGSTQSSGESINKSKCNDGITKSLNDKPNYIKELFNRSQTSFGKTSYSSMVKHLNVSTQSSGESANKSKDNDGVTKSLNKKPNFIQELFNRSQTSLDKNSDSGMVNNLQGSTQSSGESITMDDPGADKEDLVKHIFLNKTTNFIEDQDKSKINALSSTVSAQILRNKCEATKEITEDIFDSKSLSITKQTPNKTPEDSNALKSNNDSIVTSSSDDLLNKCKPNNNSNNFLAKLCKVTEDRFDSKSLSLIKETPNKSLEDSNSSKNRSDSILTSNDLLNKSNNNFDDLLAKLRKNFSKSPKKSNDNTKSGNKPPVDNGLTEFAFDGSINIDIFDDDDDSGGFLNKFNNIKKVGSDNIAKGTKNTALENTNLDVKLTNSENIQKKNAEDFDVPGSAKKLKMDFDQIGDVNTNLIDSSKNNKSKNTVKKCSSKLLSTNQPEFETSLKMDNLVPDNSNKAKAQTDNKSKNTVKPCSNKLSPTNQPGNNLDLDILQPEISKKSKAKANRSFTNFIDNSTSKKVGNDNIVKSTVGNKKWMLN